MDADTAIECVRCLVEDGYQDIEQLRGVRGNAWSCTRFSTRQSLDGIARFVTARADLQDEKNSVLSMVERMLNSGAKKNPITKRFEGGPMRAVRNAGIAGWSDDVKRQRLDDARLSVSVDSITGGRKSYISAVRGYLLFMKEMFPNRVPVPPRGEDLILWSQFFEHGGTFATYCSAVRWITEACCCDTSAFDDPVLRRAKTALKLITRPKQKRWVGAKLTQKLMRMAIMRFDGAMAMMYCAAYVFLARVPSELLAWQYDGERITHRDATESKIAVQFTSSEMRVHMATRKNARQGDTVRRGCSCYICEALCPIHIIGPWLTKCAVGEAPFGEMSAATATRKLRNDLEACGVQDFVLYSLHSFRRGGAQDMKEMGCSVEDTQRAGGWQSRAYFGYLQPEDVNTSAVVNSMVDDSDSD